jgi:uncharacterized protein
MARSASTELQGLIVAKLLEAIPDCLAVYRFGSWLTDAERPESDIDIAFLAPEALPPVRRWELAQSLASIAGRDVDLVELLTVSTVLRMQVVAHGELLHETDPGKVAQFADTVFSSYARLNEERREILADVVRRGNVYGK